MLDRHRPCERLVGRRDVLRWSWRLTNWRTSLQLTGLSSGAATTPTRCALWSTRSARALSNGTIAAAYSGPKARYGAESESPAAGGTGPDVPVRRHRWLPIVMDGSSCVLVRRILAPARARS